MITGEQPWSLLDSLDYVIGGDLNGLILAKVKNGAVVASRPKFSRLIELVAGAICEVENERPKRFPPRHCFYVLTAHAKKGCAFAGSGQAKTGRRRCALLTIQ
jgi:hypothetical protein